MNYTPRFTKYMNRVESVELERTPAAIQREIDIETSKEKRAKLEMELKQLLEDLVRYY